MTADDALREEIARALYESRVVMGEPNTAWDRLQAAFRADWLYLASAILPIVARVEQEAYRRGQAWSEGECACGQYGNAGPWSLADNPYREEN